MIAAATAYFIPSICLKSFFYRWIQSFHFLSTSSSNRRKVFRVTIGKENAVKEVDTYT